MTFPFPIVAVASKGPLTFVSALEDSTNTNNVTVGTFTLPPALAGRLFVVIIHDEDTNILADSVQIGGNTMSSVVTQTIQNVRSAAIYQFQSDTLTGDVNVTYDLNETSEDQHAVSVYYIDNLSSTIAHDTLAVTDVSSSSVSGTINIPSNGILIAGHTLGSFSVESVTWTGVGEDYDIVHNLNEFLYSGASDYGLASETGKNIIVNAGSVKDDLVLVAASWS